MQKLNLLFMTSRPLSWVNTAYPFAAGYLMLGGGIDVRLVIGTLFFLIPYNLLMYGINDVFDYESDIRNPRKGGVEGAVTPKKYHSLIVWSSIISVIPFLAYLMLSGSVLSAVTLVLVMFFVVAYSAKYLRFKEIPFLDSVTSSIHFVGPLVYAYTLVGANDPAWVIALAFFAWGIASQAFGAVQDVIPDREASIHSIATVMGARFTVLFALTLYAIAAVLVALLGGYGLVAAVAALLYVANVAPFVAVTDETSAATRAGWKRFLWINYLTGAIITMCLVAISLSV